ncbi:hypothetical protein MTO96_045530 [Rhipicephalus appendiculatus]
MRETPVGQPLNMTLLKQRGYDPTTLSWSSIPTTQPEDGPSTISAEQADIFQLVEGRRRRRKNAGGASAPRNPVNNPVTGDASVQSPKASQKSSSPVSKWTPKRTASAARAQDIGAPSKTEAPAVWQDANPWQWHQQQRYHLERRNPQLSALHLATLPATNPT